MTTCSQAIKNWEAKNEASAEEATVVKLYCQMPPIAKLDNSLNTLKNCEQLSLSTNCIDRIIPLAGMKNLKILSLGRNCIKKSGLEELTDVLFMGNPIYEGMSKEEARIEVLRHVPQVGKIDGDMVKPTEREAANPDAAAA